MTLGSIMSVGLVSSAVSDTPILAFWCVRVYSDVIGQQKGKTMTIIETQKAGSKGAQGKVRIYNIEGPKEETIIGFWQWLKDQGVIERFEVSKQEASA